MGARRYKFDGEMYSAKEIIDMGKMRMISDIKPFRDSVDQWILAQILYRGGMPRMAKKIEKIATDHQAVVGRLRYSTSSERQKIRSHKRYCRKIDRFRYISISLHNGSSFLRDLLNDTLDFHDIPREEVSHDNNFPRGLVDYSSLTTEQCEAIAKNFKRKLKGKSMISMDADCAKSR